MRFINTGLIVISILCSTAIFAHPAEEIVLSYDNTTNLLSIRIAHATRDFNKHYIEKVWVSVNKKVRIVQSFKSQDDLEKLELQYKIFNLKKGDVISVETRCNIYGKKEASLEIE